MSEENKENGFNHVKTFTKIIFIFSVLVFNDNESVLAPLFPDRGCILS
nr:hypothetical protein [Escherichia coli]